MKWKYRNGYVFDRKMQDPRSVTAGIIAFGRAMEGTCGFAASGSREERSWNSIGWSPPPLNWVTLNTDGSVRGLNFSASSGGILRDSQDKWVFGYGRNIGSCSVLKAELWGIWDGLHLAWQHGFRNVILETNCKVAVETIIKEETMENDYYGLVIGIRNLLNRDWIVRCNHIYRERNRCADQLANDAASLPLGVHFFQEPIHGILNTIIDDLAGVCFPRLVTV